MVQCIVFISNPNEGYQHWHLLEAEVVVECLLDGWTQNMINKTQTGLEFGPSSGVSDQQSVGSNVTPSVSLKKDTNQTTHLKD